MIASEITEQEKLWNAAKPFPSLPWIQPFKQDIDRTLLRKNLEMTVEERCQQLASMARFVDQLQKARQLKKQELWKQQTGQ